MVKKKDQNISKLEKLSYNHTTYPTLPTLWVCDLFSATSVPRDAHLHRLHTVLYSFFVFQLKFLFL